MLNRAIAKNLRKLGLSPMLPRTQRRPISTVVDHTKFASPTSQSVSSPGHIWWKTNAYEQRVYGLPEFIGHSGSGRASKSATVSGTLPATDHPDVSGRAFTVPGLQSQPQPYMQDTHRHYTDEINHGTLNPEQARILKSHLAPPVYETSGIMRANCVHAHASAATALGAPLPHTEDHLTPQGLFQRLKNWTLGS